MISTNTFAGLAAAAVLASGGVAGAYGWVDAFEATRLVPVTIDTESLTALPDLEQYGEVDVSGGGVGDVADAAAAEQATGLAVPTVDELPSAISGEPDLQVADQVTANLRFTTEQARQAGLGGVSLRVVAGPGVAAVWRGASGLPALIVASVAVPTVSTSGAEFDDVRQRLLSLPGVSPEVAELLRSYERGTLPLPIPEGARLDSADVEIGGHPATMITSGDGSMSAVIWVDAGVATLVAGTLSADEVTTVAEGLR
jgi:hypothetical protein